MIDEKKIEEAASKYSDKYLYLDEDNTPCYSYACEEAFKTGINWFLDNLWHDGEEIPTEKNKDVLMYFESYSVGERECDFDEHYELCYTGNDGFNGNTWKIFCDAAGWCSKWFYVDDLLKGGK